MTQVRAKKVKEKIFLAGYVKGCKAGLDNDAIAETLGMNVESMISRASTARTKYADMGVILPSPSGESLTKEEKLADNVSFLAGLLADVDDETGDETDDETDENSDRLEAEETDDHQI